jgi:quercetin dioxygenase-like cupin family protein
MVSLRLQHKETTGVETFWVGLSYYLPGGGVEMAANDFEVVYFVLSGMLTVIAEDGTKYILKPTDSLYIPAGEKRRLINETNEPASMLVIAGYPKK